MKFRSLAILMLAEFGAMSLWFISAAILPAMVAEAAISPVRQAALSSGVQAGFVIGALLSAVVGLADRFDPRRVFTVSVFIAAVANLMLLWVVPGGDMAIAMRFLTGAALAGVYPVGMKIVVGWGLKDRGLLVGAVVGALTLGSAMPHLISLLGGADWRITVIAASVIATLAGVAVPFAKLGPHHSSSSKFDPKAVLQAWTNKRVRYAFFGYFGHMWELYAMWAWIGAIALASYSQTMDVTAAQRFATLTAAIAIAAGAPFCVAGGLLADRFGKAEVAIGSLVLSGLFAVLCAATFGGPVWISFTLFILWGIAIIPDSALFSAIVADVAPPDQVGSLMTLQTAFGFTLTFVTVQATPVIASSIGWPFAMVLMSFGPLFGIASMQSLRTILTPIKSE